MAYANMEGGDHPASSSAPVVVANRVDGIESAESNEASRRSNLQNYRRGPNRSILMPFNDANRGNGERTSEYPAPGGVQQPMQLRYVLSPSPTFDPVFDDLLEGGIESGTSGVREQTSTKSDNASMDESAKKIEYLNELLRDEKKLSTMPDFYHLQKVSTVFFGLLRIVLKAASFFSWLLERSNESETTYVCESIRRTRWKISFRLKNRASFVAANSVSSHWTTCRLAWARS